MAEQQESQTRTQAGLQPSQQQIAVAQALQIAGAASLPVTQLIEQIESKLGRDTPAEQARWYLMSVLRHLNRDDWSSLEASGIAREMQQELIDRFLATGGAKRALGLVLKESHCRFTLLRFAKARRVDQHVLSTTTKAYCNAVSLLQELELVVGKQTSASSRRAARRKPPASIALPDKESTAAVSVGGSAETPLPVAEQGTGQAVAVTDQQAKPDGRQERQVAAAVLADSGREPQLGDDEFARIDALVTAAPPPAPNWQEAKKVDRQSLLLGLGAGALLFLLILLFY